MISFDLVGIFVVCILCSVTIFVYCVEGATAEYHCFVGYGIVGTSTVTCGQDANNTWSQEPQCVVGRWTPHLPHALITLLTEIEIGVHAR